MTTSRLSCSLTAPAPPVLTHSVITLYSHSTMKVCMKPFHEKGLYLRCRLRIREEHCGPKDVEVWSSFEGPFLEGDPALSAKPDKLMNLMKKVATPSRVRLDN